MRTAEPLVGPRADRKVSWAMLGDDREVAPRMMHATALVKPLICKS